MRASAAARAVADLPDPVRPLPPGEAAAIAEDAPAAEGGEEGPAPADEAAAEAPGTLAPVEPIAEPPADGLAVGPIIAVVLLLVLGLMLPFLVDVALGDASEGAGAWIAGLMRWIATGFHLEKLLEGVIDTADIAYFVVVSGSFLLLDYALNLSSPLTGCSR